MQETTKTRWLDLCAEAAICEDPQRLQELTEVIATVLKQAKRQLEAAANRFRTAPSGAEVTAGVVKCESLH